MLSWHIDNFHVSEIRWRLCIDDAEPSSYLGHNLCHRMWKVISVPENAIPRKLIGILNSWSAPISHQISLIHDGSECHLHVVHDDVIKWKHFPRYWPFVRRIHRSPVNSPHKGQWRGALMFTLICTRINGWVNNREAGDLRHYRTHYDVIVMSFRSKLEFNKKNCLSWWRHQMEVFSASLAFVRRIHRWPVNSPHKGQ